MKRALELDNHDSKKIKLEWNVSLISLKDYIDKYHKLPSTRNNDIQIVNLAKWYYLQKLNYNTLRDDHKKDWDDFMLNYYHKINSNQNWINNLNKLKEYIKKFGKPPTLGNETYKKLSKWLNNQKQRIYMRDDYTKKLWDEFNKEYLVTNDDWYDNLEKLKSYITLNKETPLQNDELYENRILSSWLSRQKRYYNDNMLKEEYIIKWEEFLNDFGHYLMTSKEEWCIKLDVLKQYIDVHKKKPIQKVHYLGNWLYMQQQYYKQYKYNMKHPSIRKKWEEFNEEYKQYLNIHEIWMSKLRSLKSYIDQHDRLPLKNSDMYNWLRTQQKNYVNKRLKHNHQHWEQFMMDYKDYFNNRKIRWLSNLQKIKDYMSIHSHAPSPYDKQHRKLGIWLIKQQELYNKNKIKNTELKETWDLFKSQYYNPETYWKNALNNVIQYIKHYKKIPSNDDKNKNIRGLLIWMNAQYNHYHKSYGLMNNTTIRQLWEKFLIDHKDIIIYK